MTTMTVVSVPAALSAAVSGFCAEHPEVERELLQRDMWQWVANNYETVSHLTSLGCWSRLVTMFATECAAYLADGPLNPWTGRTSIATRDAWESTQEDWNG